MAIFKNHNRGLAFWNQCASFISKTVSLIPGGEVTFSGLLLVFQVCQEILLSNAL